MHKEMPTCRVSEMRSVLSFWSQCHKVVLQQQISDRASPGQLLFLFWRKHHSASIYNQSDFFSIFFSDSKSYTNNRFTIIKSAQQICLESKILHTVFVCLFSFSRFFRPTLAWAHMDRGSAFQRTMMGHSFPSTRALVEGPQHLQGITGKTVGSFSIPFRKGHHYQQARSATASRPQGQSSPTQWCVACLLQQALCALHPGSSVVRGKPEKSPQILPLLPELPLTQLGSWNWQSLFISFVWFSLSFWRGNAHTFP